MQTTVESTDKHTVKVTIEVPTEELEKDLDKAYRSIANQVKIPGFRKGKVPKKIIDAQVGRDVVVEEFISESVPLYYRRALSNEDLAPITDPEIDLEPFEDGKPLVFTATVEIRPRLELTEDDYGGLKITRPSGEVTDAEIDSWVERLRERHAELEPAERPVRNEDFVTIDIRATNGSVEIEEIGRTDYVYFVSSGEFGEAVDAEIAGKKVGDILKFDGELPGRFGEELGGTIVSFQVLVKDVKSRRLPDADDALAKMASEFDTLAELRDDLRVRLGELKEREAEEIVRDRVLQAMIDTVDVDIPESLIDEETDHRVKHAKDRAEQAGLDFEQMLETQGWDEARLQEDSRQHAIRAIRSDLALEGIARAEKIQVSADELGIEIAALAQAYQRDPKELAKALDSSGQIVTLAGDIIRRKALDLLVERADIEPESEPASPEGEPAPTEASEE
ncbi:MAG: trigger factor [Actinomycetota bacterium]|nr:trigger factor [Actinomycetota bacterium]